MNFRVEKMQEGQGRIVSLPLDIWQRLAMCVCVCASVDVQASGVTTHPFVQFSASF
jgi:hypothetical protein